MAKVHLIVVVKDNNYKSSFFSLT